MKLCFVFVNIFIWEKKFSSCIFFGKEEEKTRRGEEGKQPVDFCEIFDKFYLLVEKMKRMVKKRGSGDEVYC